MKLVAPTIMNIIKIASINTLSLATIPADNGENPAVDIVVKEVQSESYKDIPADQSKIVCRATKPRYIPQKILAVLLTLGVKASRLVST